MYCSVLDCTAAWNFVLKLLFCTGLYWHALVSSLSLNQCVIGRVYQKYTTLMVSPGMDPYVSALSGLRCTHPSAWLATYIHTYIAAHSWGFVCRAARLAIGIPIVKQQFFGCLSWISSSQDTAMCGCGRRCGDNWRAKNIGGQRTRTRTKRVSRCGWVQHARACRAEAMHAGGLLPAERRAVLTSNGHSLLFLVHVVSWQYR